MKHLQEVEMTYAVHLSRAWLIAFILIVHGIFPWIWEHTASDMLCNKD